MFMHLKTSPKYIVVNWRKSELDLNPYNWQQNNVSRLKGETEPKEEVATIIAEVLPIIWVLQLQAKLESNVNETATTS
jgi:hypothetical protein